MKPILISIFIASSIFASAQNPLKLGMPVTIQSAHKKGFWKDVITYPKIVGADAFAQLARATVVGEETAIYNIFRKEAVNYWANPGPGDQAKWGYEATTKLVYNGYGIASFVSQSYWYQGGAHGIGVTRTYNFGIVNGKPKRLTLADCCKDKLAKEDLATLLFQVAQATPFTDWIQDDTLQEFTEEQLNRFWIATEGLVFEFNPYELGSYASGPFTFKLKWAQIKDLLRKGGPITIPKN
ncbi:MAG: DUF3298 and DUF4163 domain-containing protein [Armatimonadetes bacterium]|nr:DUF3298 and DUF4163 domain-containing protein [Armatimonadota bacterium]